MLTEQERREIEKELQGVAPRQAACIEALKVVQRHRGWVADEIVGIAEMLGMTAAELDSVATFYSRILRKPVGRHVILVCDSVSCWIMGCNPVLERLDSRLGIGPGETSADGRFTLLPVSCLGVCDHAPAMMINTVLYQDLTPEKIDEILEKHR